MFVDSPRFRSSSFSSAVRTVFALITVSIFGSQVFGCARALWEITISNRLSWHFVVCPGTAEVSGCAGSCFTASVEETAGLTAGVSVLFSCGGFKIIVGAVSSSCDEAVEGDDLVDSDDLGDGWGDDPVLESSSASSCGIILDGSRGWLQ